MNDVNNVADFDKALNLTIELLKKLREEGHAQPVLLSTLHEKLFDLSQFTVTKRQQALKKVNTALGTSWSMNQVKKAKADKPAAKSVEKAIHTDGLAGATNVPAKLTKEEATEEAGAPAVISGGELTTTAEPAGKSEKDIEQDLQAAILRGGSIAGNLIQAVAQHLGIEIDDVEGRAAHYHSYLSTIGDAALDDFSNKIVEYTDKSFFPETDIAFAVIIADSFNGDQDGFLTYLAAFANQSQSSNTCQELNQENDTMTNLNQATLAEQVLNASPLRQGDNAVKEALAPKTYTEASQQFKDLLESAGITSMDQFKTVAFNFVRANLDLTPKLLAVGQANPNLDEMAGFEQLIKTYPEVAPKFTAFIFVPANHLPSEAATVAAEPDTFGGKVMRSMRGNRETGFSSGVVAAAAAVVGGGAEMFFRGGASIGSGVGTVVGAVGGYFAAEAAEKLMNSETGRYILAGSIGLVAGGVGSSLGRTVETRGVAGIIPGNAPAEALPEVVRPLPSPAAADGFVPMFGA